MAEPEEVLREVLDRHSRRTLKTIFDGIATDITDSSFTLKRENAPDLFDVRLNAVDDNLQTRITVKPKDGSHVVVGIISNLDTEAVMLKCSEIDQVLVKIGAAEVTINDEGVNVAMGGVEFDIDGSRVLLKKGGDTLSAILTDLIAEIAKIVVLMGTSPNVAALTAIDNRQKQFLG